MHVEAAEPRQREHVGRQQQSIGDDDHDVRRKRRDRFARVGAAQGLGLPHGNAERERALLDRACGEAAAAAARPVGLGEDGDEPVPRGGDRLERGQCEVRCSGEDDRQAGVHGGAAGQIAGARDVSGARPSARSFRSFSSFLRTRWRFISER